MWLGWIFELQIKLNFEKSSPKSDKSDEYMDL